MDEKHLMNVAVSAKTRRVFLALENQYGSQDSKLVEDLLEWFHAQDTETQAHILEIVNIDGADTTIQEAALRPHPQGP
jgi:hypothetical protein